MIGARSYVAQAGEPPFATGLCTQCVRAFSTAAYSVLVVVMGLGVPLIYKRSARQQDCSVPSSFWN